VAENWFRRLLLRPSRWPERQRSTLWISGWERESNFPGLRWLQPRRLREPEQAWCRRFGRSGGHRSPPGRSPRSGRWRRSRIGPHRRAVVPPMRFCSSRAGRIPGRRGNATTFYRFAMIGKTSAGSSISWFESLFAPATVWSSCNEGIAAVPWTAWPKDATLWRSRWRSERQPRKQESSTLHGSLLFGCGLN
jgi:hypothetical protein